MAGRPCQRAAPSAGPLRVQSLPIGASAYTAFASPDATQPAAPAVAADLGQGNGYGNGNVNTGTVTDHNGNGTGTSVLDIPASDLNEEEISALLFMREEEKLARDVYNALYAIDRKSTRLNSSH